MLSLVPGALLSTPQLLQRAAALLLCSLLSAASSQCFSNSCPRGAGVEQSRMLPALILEIMAAG